MKVFELLFLLNKYLQASIVRSPKTARYIIAAYSNVNKKIRYAYDNNKELTNADIQKLDLTDRMTNKLQFLLTQKIPASEIKKLKQKQLIYELMDFAGIGKTKAKSLINSGLTKISDLSKKKYKEQLTDSTIMLMKYKPVRKIPHTSIKKIEKKLTSFPNSKLVGGFLRKMPFSKDIDIMLISNKKTILDDYIKYLNNKFNDVKIYIKGNDKVSLIILVAPKKYFKVDVFRSSVANQHAMLLYSTGSKEFNIKMRGIASRMGYLLNQNGLYKKGSKTPLPIKSEKGFFNKLNMDYVKPEDR